jgi:SAM-dependent methyltransferase
MDTLTIQTYDEMAQAYDEETRDFWDRFPRTFFDAFANLVRGKVLDVGSGPGRDGTVLAERGLEVTCLDASEAMVRLCEEKGLLSVLGDFSALPFPDGAFGGVWSYTALLHVPKAEVSKAIEEIRRVLKDGGILGLGLIEGEGEGYREQYKGVLKPRWFSYYDKEEVERLLNAHGFHLLHFESFKPGSRNYLNFIAKKA